MKPYEVVFTPEARRQLADLYQVIATEASPAMAGRYVGAVVAAL